MTHFDPQRGAGFDDFSDERKGSNVLGIVGFILSLLCVTAPLGLLISLIALFKQPRGFAIAGAIIGILFSAVMGVAAWSVVKIVPFATGMSYLARISVDHEIIKRQAEQFNAESGAWPAALTAMNLPPNTSVDPWGKPYQYVLKDELWTITTAGPDGEFGNEDDFTIGRGEDMNNNNDANKLLIEHWSTERSIRAGIDAWKQFFNDVKSIDQWQNTNSGMSAVAGGGPLDSDADAPADDDTDEPEDDES